MLESIIGGSALSTAGDLYANYTNRKIAQENRSFQQSMSSTSYQRAMADMKKAGLNPMLAYMKGGASTPPGSSATVNSPTQNAISTALQLRMQNEEIKNIQARTENVKEQTRVLGIPADVSGTGSEILDATKKFLKSGLHSAEDIYKGQAGSPITIHKRLFESGKNSAYDIKKAYDHFMQKTKPTSRRYWENKYKDYRRNW